MRHGRARMLGATVVALAFWVSGMPAEAAPSGAVELLSQTADGSSANDLSFRVSISADGSRAAFFSYASNYVPSDTNEKSDIFLRDRSAGTTTLISRAANGAPADGHSYGPAISRDGRYVVYESNASNLVTGDIGDDADIFLFDTLTHTTTRITKGLGGAEPNGSNWFGVLSPDATAVAYWSAASNLVAGDTNGSWDVFVYDLHTRRTELVSVDEAGVQAAHWAFFPECLPALSNRGERVAFCSEAELTSTAPRARHCSSRQGRTTHRPTAGHRMPASPRTVGSSPFGARRRTWCLPTPTDSGTCSCVTSRRARPNESP
jgi:Tol biopolymer transport system component